jgi:hypothetical protein
VQNAVAALPPGMYPTCRTNGVWRSLVARPLWERKVVGSNPATPTTGNTAAPHHQQDHNSCKIALWVFSCLPLLCKLCARVSLNRAEF